VSPVNFAILQKMVPSQAVSSRPASDPIRRLTRCPFDDPAHQRNRLGEGAKAVTPVFASDIPLRVDVAQLHAHTRTFLWQKAMPGMIANAEH